MAVPHSLMSEQKWQPNQQALPLQGGCNPLQDHAGCHQSTFCCDDSSARRLHAASGKRHCRSFTWCNHRTQSRDVPLSSCNSMPQLQHTATIPALMVLGHTAHEDCECSPACDSTEHTHLHAIARGGEPALPLVTRWACVLHLAATNTRKRTHTYTL
jgi:hypothetical protein